MNNFLINKILFIRRDNIGDLVCTTPSIHAVKRAYPKAKIGILVNSYNAEVVSNNSDIDEIYIYEKAKHVQEKNKLKVWYNNTKILMKIRKENYDVAIACGSYSLRLARYTFMSGARIRIGYLPKETNSSIFYNIPIREPQKPLHEVERVFGLLSPLGINGSPDKLRVFPSQSETQRIKEHLHTRGLFSNKQSDKPLIAFHISSRRPENRWTVENFINLTKLILKNKKVNIILLWSPGSENNPYHPGDDEKADLIIRAVPEIIPFKTLRLSELISILSFVQLIVCLDGGAMHIGAALSKPIVAIWGSTDSDRWRPWGVEHILVRDNSKNAKNIDVNQVYEAVIKLLKEPK